MASSPWVPEIVEPVDGWITETAGGGRTHVSRKPSIAVEFTQEPSPT